MKLFPEKPGNFFPNATKKIYSHIDGISQQEFDMVNLRQNPGKPSLLKGEKQLNPFPVTRHPLPVTTSPSASLSSPSPFSLRLCVTPLSLPATKHPIEQKNP
jgi:hypothetical protein